MGKLNDLTIVAILFGAIYAVFLITIVILFKRSPNSNIFQNWPAMSKLHLPQSKAGLLVLVISAVCVILIVICAVMGSKDLKIVSKIDRDTTTVNNPGVSGFGNVEHFGESVDTYVPKGYGPVLDKTKVQNWINGSAGSMGLNLTPDKTAWPDGNGTPIAIPSEQFKALYGFIPPSFAYYPKGQTKNDYNETNYKTGRENCMKACSLTNCIAVQTEIPENCAQEANPTKDGNSCGSNSAFSCTLFYDNIKNADDAYWTVDNFSSGHGLSSSPGCFEATNSSCLGKKYYENNAAPIELPSKISKPSENIVTFCDSTITKTNNAGYGVRSGSCSCTNAGSCNDSNCCIMRPLLTTEYAQNKHPYYSLPINVSKTAGVLSGNYSMVVPSINYKNGSPSSCGIVGSGAGEHLVSCNGSAACGSGSDTSDCWKIDPSSCTGTPFDESSGATALANYKSHYAAAQGKNYDDLYPSCYYRQQLTVVQPVQFNCDPAVVTRGCWGSPPILYTESLTSPDNFTACSDSTAIPDSQRCQNVADKASCKGFPYSCGSSNGTSTLWVKQ